MKKTWTEEENNWLQENYPILGGRVCAEKLGRTYVAVRRHANVVLGLRVKASVNEDYFRTWTPNMAYTLGYIYADGCIRPSYLALRCTSKDDDIIRQILEDMSSQHRLHYIDAHTDKRGWNIAPTTFANVSNVALVKSLIEIGLEQAKSSKDLPCPDVPEEFLPHFVRGYFDGDGNVTIKEGRYYSFSFVGTQTFCEQLRDKIASAVSICRRPLSRQGKIWSVCWSHLEDVRKITTWLYPPGNYIFLDRKRVKLDSIHAIPEKAHRSKYFEYNGKQTTLEELSKEFDVPYLTLLDRIGKQGWDIEKALTTPLAYQPIEYNGIIDTLTNHAARVGLPMSVVKQRYYRLKWSLEKTLSTPVNKQKSHPRKSGL